MADRKWIKAESSYPPDCMEVLLYVTTYHDSDLKHEYDSCFMVGFYSEESLHDRPTGYYIEKPDTSNHLYEMIEDERTKVIAWSFTPEVTSNLEQWKKAKGNP